MQYLGELISLAVAILWTATAVFADEASHRIGSLTTNIFRMGLSIIFIGFTLLVTTGHILPQYTDARVWFWLSLSGLVGYVFGDFCLFNSYIHIGSRYGQLFMTLAPPTSAVLGWLFLGEKLGWISFVAMAVTLCGIGMSILSKGSDGKMHTHLPMKGILFGIGAGLGQGSGLVLSKIGMDFYTASVPADAASSVSTMMPFASTMIRAITGLAGFLLLMVIYKDGHKLRAALHNPKGMAFTFGTTFFGPFLGVSLSLMAVQYTKAGIASTIMALTPALIIIPHWLFYHKHFTFKEIVGTIISLVGVALFFVEV